MIPLNNSCQLLNARISYLFGYNLRQKKDKKLINNIVETNKTNSENVI